MTPSPFSFPTKSNNDPSTTGRIVCVGNALHQKPKGIRRVFIPLSLLMDLPKSSSSCDSFFQQHHQQQQQKQYDSANDGSILRTLLDRMDGLNKVRRSASATTSSSSSSDGHISRRRMLEPNALQGRHQIIGQDRGSSGSSSINVRKRSEIDDNTGSKLRKI
jgi:hypothetical protein